MGRGDRRRRARGGLALLALVASAAIAPGAPAQAIAPRTFGVRDGLVHERVNDFLEDRFGFLWIATWEGVSRFDGRRFVSWSTADGVPRSLVWCMGESRGGRVWLGTSTGGAARMIVRDDGTTAFEAVPVAAATDDDDSIEKLAFSATGELLVVTPAGLLLCARPDDARPAFELLWPSPDRRLGTQALANVGDWTVALGARPLVAVRGGETRVLPAPPGDALPEAVHTQPRPDGSALVATTAGLFAFDPAALDGAAPPWRRLDVDLPFDERPHALAWGGDGSIWIGTTRGIHRVRDGRVERIVAASGLPDEYVRDLEFDRAGALWIGLQSAGCARLDAMGLESFQPRDRRAPLSCSRLLEGDDGTIVTSSGDAGLWRVEGGELRLVDGSEAPDVRDCHLRFARGADGRWWIGGEEGLRRTRGAALDLAGLETVVMEGATQRVFGELFVDRDGDVWLGDDDGRLLRVARDAADAARQVAEFPVARDYPPRACGEDTRGRLWIAPGDRLWRRRDDGTFEVVALPGCSTPPRPRALASDGPLLWIGTRHDGVVALAVDEEPPRVVHHLTARDGLPSDFVLAVAIDRDGAAWFGTGRGLVRRDPADGTLRRFGPAEGLPGSTVHTLLVDRAGALWIATSRGVARLDPRRLAPPGERPRLYVAGVEAGGRAVALPSRGLAEIGGTTVPADRRDVVAEFTAVDLAGRALSYSHRIVTPGAADPPWSAPHAEGAVRCAELAPGRYVVEARALDPDGVASAPARVAFEVLAPWWESGWFRTAAVVAALAIAAALHRLRVARALESERMRTEIATDLHDDAGANLAQIAILAEVARRDASPALSGTLRDVAELARSARASIADLVWAVDPRRDTLRDLVQRLRQAALHLLEPQGVRVEVVAPDSDSAAQVELPPATRRHLHFALQELLHNCARHAGARAVTLAIALADGRVSARVEDDGSGFDPAAPSDGHGLASVRRRVAALGGTVRWSARPGGGTRVELEAPLAGPRRPRIFVRWNGRSPGDRMGA